MNTDLHTRIREYLHGDADYDPRVLLREVIAAPTEAIGSMRCSKCGHRADVMIRCVSDGRDAHPDALPDGTLSKSTVKRHAALQAVSRRIFIDMDGVIVDFDRYRDERGLTGDQVKVMQGAYLDMPAIPGAIEAVRSLIGMGYEVWLATKPPTGVPHAYSDKAAWVFRHLPELKRRVIITHDKGLLGGPDDFLCDDRPHKANCEQFPGHLLRFVDGFHWPEALEFFREQRAAAPTGEVSGRSILAKHSPTVLDVLLAADLTRLDPIQLQEWACDAQRALAGVDRAYKDGYDTGRMHAAGRPKPTDGDMARALDTLRGLLCNPDGMVVIGGSDGDRQAIADSLDAIEEAIAAYDPERVGAVTVNLMDELFAAFNTWPADIRKKLSLHDLRRMTGWAPPKHEASPAQPEEMSPDFTDTARAALAWVLYHHQGGSSPVGQPIRMALGMGNHEPLPDWRIAEAKRYAELVGAKSADFHFTRAAGQQDHDIDALVNRFLGWRLPADFAPDAGVAFTPPPADHGEHWWPVGTNLLSAEQARAMFEHCLAGVP